MVLNRVLGISSRGIRQTGISERPLRLLGREKNREANTRSEQAVGLKDA